MNSTLLTYSNKKTNRAFTKWLVMLLMIFSFSAGMAQVASYTQEQLPLPSYTNLPATKTVIHGGTWDDPAPASIPIGFTFNFNGTNYTSLFVSANGFVTFGSAPAAGNYVPISTGGGYDGAIAAYAVNLSVAGTVAGTPQPNSVSYELVGSAPNRELIIEWRLFRRASTDAGNTMNMQIHLFETSNVVEIHYDEMPAVPSVGTSTNGQVGLRGATNADFNNLWHAASTIPTRPWPIAPSVIPPGDTNARAVRITAGTTQIITAAANRLFRWTPNFCNAPSGLAMSNVLISTATLSYSIPSPTPNNFQYEIRTAGAPGTALGPNDVSGSTIDGTVNSINITGLTPGTTYTAYIRSFCGGSNYSGWVSVGPFTTLCSAAAIPYFLYFDTATIPNLPACTSRQNLSAGNLWTTVNSDGDSGIFDEHLIYTQSGTQAANVWFYTQGVTLVAGTTYELSYLYGGSSVPSTVTNRMEVKYGLSPTNGGMSLPLANHTNIKGSPSNNTVLFTAPTSDVYYFGFRAYSLAAQGKLFLDDIQIIESSCQTPISLAVDVPSIASTSATVTWSIPNPSPAPNQPSGYQYYVTTVNPEVNMGANLIAGQSYTITSVGSFDFTTVGASSNTVGNSFVATPAPVTAGSFVVGQSYTINSLGSTNFTLVGATANAIGVQFIATAAGSGTGNALPLLVPTSGTGTVESNLNVNTTPSGATGAGVTVASLSGLANNTTYYVYVRSICSIGIFSQWTPYVTFTTLNVPPYCIPSSASGTTFINNFTTTGGITNIANISGFALPTGYIDYTTTSQEVTQAPGQSVTFNLSMTTPINAGVAIWVDWGNPPGAVGTFETAERVYNSAAYVTGATGTITVPPGTPTGVYRMRVMVDYWATNPSPCVINTLFGNQQGEVEDYNFRVVPPPPALTLSSITSAQCANTNSPLVTLTAGGPPTYNTYTWTPATGVSGSAAAGWTFNNTTTTVYTLTAVQTVAPFSLNTVKYTYQATPAPTAVTVLPATPSICQSGPAELLTASGGIVNNSVALNENFEGGAPTWTRTNLSTGGSIVNAAWTDRASGYNVSAQTLVSNDNSTFVMSNSDAQGIGTTTSTQLTSPVFSLANYTDANLVFYHYFRAYINGTAVVEISTNGGGTWTTLQTWSTINQGTASAFALVNINLNAYINQTNLRLRFNYNGNWAWWWAIDNVTVQGTRLGQIVWNTTPPTVGTNFVTPIPGLFTDAAATTPYTLNTVSNTVYALPSAAVTFTASTNVAGCSTSANVPVTLIPVVAGTVSGTQANCDTSAFTNLTLAGHSGTIVRWEYADNAAFTIGVTPIANTTTTLTPAEFGTFSTVRYFRAVVGNGVCNTVNSNVVSVTFTNTILTGTNTWSNGLPAINKKVIIAGNYTATADFAACSIQVLTGATLTINSGVTVTVQNEFVVDGPSLPNTVVFQNGSTLLQNTDATNSGSIRYIRNSSPIIQYDYTYWSSPVANQVLSAFSPNTNANRFYVFDHTVTNYQWLTVSNASVMTAAKGYIIRAPNTVSTTVPAPWAGEFYGVPNNGPYSINVVLSGSGDRNLLGNPYPSAIFADDLYNENSSVLNGNFYFWTHNTPITANNYNANDYASYNGVGGVGTAAPTTGVNTSIPSGNIGAGQGFFVGAAATGTVNFNNTIRVYGNNNQFYRSGGIKVETESVEKHRLWINLINNQGAYKQTLIGYIQGATNERDQRFDADLTEAGNSVSIYSLLNQDKLTIQGRTLPFQVTDVIPMGVRTTLAGEYTIQLENFDGLFAQGQNVYLEDKLLGIVHDLKQGDYTFSTTGGTINDRFEIQFEEGALSVNNPKDLSNAIIVYKNNEIIFVNAGNEIMTEVKLFDARGRLITTKSNIQTSEVQFDGLQVANQLLLIQITTENGEKVTKKIAY